MDHTELLTHAKELVRLAGKHSNLWTKDDYDSFRTIRDAVDPSAENVEEPLNIFGYSEAEWRILPQSEKTRLIYERPTHPFGGDGCRAYDSA